MEVLSPTEIKAKTAPGSAGEHEVVVTDANGTSAAGAKYTYIAPPTITSIEPPSGTTAGGTSVTITGTGFVSPAKVTIGAETSEVDVLSPTEIKAKTAPGSAGEHEVVVTDANGTSAAGAKYTYIEPPTVTSIDPPSGTTAGGTSVTITGTGFVSPAKVTIGAETSEVEVLSPTEIKAKTAPGSAGEHEVVVTDANGTSAAGAKYTYIEPPTITSIEPPSGTTAGGTSVTIKGTGFGASTVANTVTIGGHEATVTAASATSLTVVTPPGERRCSHG